MKLFGLTIERAKSAPQAEQRHAAPDPVPSWFGGDGLLFGGSRNNTAMAISAVYRAVELISDSVAVLPILVTSKNDKRKNIAAHPIQRALDAMPYTRYTLVKMIVADVLLHGNGYVYIERSNTGDVMALRYFQPNDVQVEVNEKSGAVVYRIPKLTAKKVEACNVLHFKKYTVDGINGKSVISYASRSIGLANDTENSAKNFYSSGCNLSGILTVQGQLSDQQKTDIKNSWRQTYSQGGSGGLAVLQGNMSYSPVQLSATDSQLIESRNFNVSDIARFFGISPVLLGDLSHSSYSTLEGVQSGFVVQTLQPYITMIEQELTAKLLKPSERDTIAVNLDEQVIMKADKNATANYYNSLINSGVLSINEVRAELGYTSIDGGDKHIIAYTDINQNTITNNED